MVSVKSPGGEVPRRRGLLVEFPGPLDGLPEDAEKELGRLEGEEEEAAGKQVLVAQVEDAAAQPVPPGRALRAQAVLHPEGGTLPDEVAEDQVASGLQVRHLVEARGRVAEGSEVALPGPALVPAPALEVVVHDVPALGPQAPREEILHRKAQEVSVGLRADLLPQFPELQVEVLAGGAEMLPQDLLALSRPLLARGPLEEVPDGLVRWGARPGFRFAMLAFKRGGNSWLLHLGPEGAPSQSGRDSVTSLFAGVLPSAEASGSPSSRGGRPPRRGGPR